MFKGFRRALPAVCVACCLGVSVPAVADVHSAASAVVSVVESARAGVAGTARAVSLPAFQAQAQQDSSRTRVSARGVRGLVKIGIFVVAGIGALVAKLFSKRTA